MPIKNAFNNSKPRNVYSVITVHAKKKKKKEMKKKK
jgi:hypothetical protein